MFAVCRHHFQNYFEADFFPLDGVAGAFPLPFAFFPFPLVAALPFPLGAALPFPLGAAEVATREQFTAHIILEHKSLKVNHVHLSPVSSLSR